MGYLQLQHLQLGLLSYRHGNDTSGHGTRTLVRIRVGVVCEMVDRAAADDYCRRGVRLVVFGAFDVIGEWTMKQLLPVTTFVTRNKAAQV